MCWGNNDNGQLGAGSTGTFRSPQAVELAAGCIQSENFLKRNNVCLELCDILLLRPWEILMCTLKLCRLFYDCNSESWIWH